MVENPYLDTLHLAEVLDGDALHRALRAVLEDRAVVDGIRDRQERYERAVRRLPSGARAVDAWLR